MKRSVLEKLASGSRVTRREVEMFLEDSETWGETADSVIEKMEEYRSAREDFVSYADTWLDPGNDAEALREAREGLETNADDMASAIDGLRELGVDLFEGA